MEDPASSEPPTAPRSSDRPGADGAGVASPLERLASFRFTYRAIFLFVLLSVSSIGLAEAVLQIHFEDALVEAATVDASEPQIISRIQEGVDRLLRDSAWIRFGGVRVRPILLGADGRTLIYAGGARIPMVPDRELSEGNERFLLPPTVDVQVSVPLGSLLANAILVTYFGVLVTTLIVYTRTLTRREAERLSGVVSARDQVAERARQIESELAAVRERLQSVEPGLDSQAGEIRSLEEERKTLLTRLSELERREEELRGGSAREDSLQQEHAALEELLEEVLSDLEQKDQEIQELQREVKRAGRSRVASSKEGEQLARRLRRLYKQLEIDDRAIQDLVGLRDEVMKLKAEEAVKRLSDEPETAAVRRKVGGLPPQLSIFELGFAGKGRIYYTRGRQRRYRILAIGAKNTQKTDLEYLSRVPREDA
jgi:predicted nuclease with TOPRIM domain